MINSSRFESPSYLVLEIAERHVVPNKTAYFKFFVHAAETPSIQDFDVVSDNPNFNPAWSRIVRSSDGDASLARYTLEIHPTHIHRSQFGTYPLRLYWRTPGTLRRAEGECTVIIKPCVRVVVKPKLATWPSGELSFSLENCGRIGIDVSVSIRHDGSNWSQGWEFELHAGAGPFKFSEKFDPPAGSRQAEFELDISVEGVSIVRMRIHGKRLLISRKLIVTSAVVLIGIAIGTTLALAETGTTLVSQSITFTSRSPASPAIGSIYHVAAAGGASGNPVTFTIDATSSSILDLRFGRNLRPARQLRHHVNQAGNTKYQPAPPAQQTITVNSPGLATQTITFTAPVIGFSRRVIELVGHRRRLGQPGRVLG